MTEPHDRLWFEWLGDWQHAAASKPKPCYEGWLEKRLEAAEKALVASEQALKEAEALLRTSREGGRVWEHRRITWLAALAQTKEEK